jgi:transposase
MANEYWLADAEWAAIEPLIPLNRRGVKPGNNRRVISGILHVLKFGCRWRDCPSGLWTAYDHLQSVQPLLERRYLAEHV